MYPGENLTAELHRLERPLAMCDDPNSFLERMEMSNLHLKESQSISSLLDTLTIPSTHFSFYSLLLLLTLPHSLCLSTTYRLWKYFRASPRRFVF